MDEDEILRQIKADAKEDLRFHSNAAKAERERWVVGDFLRVVSLPFNISELVSPKQESPVDVEFRHARFQVKEIPDPELMRSSVVRQTFKTVEKAIKLEDIQLPFHASNIPEVTRIYDLVLVLARGLSDSGKYGDKIGSLDLLVYVTRTRAGLVQANEIVESDFAPLGWRSVSCLAGNHVAVLYSAEHSPSFLHPAPRLMSNAGTAN